MRLNPRPLLDTERPEAGDIYFANDRRLLARIIQLGTASRTNHAAGIVGMNSDGTWQVVEATGRGVIEHAIAPPHCTVLRVLDEPCARAALATTMRAQAAAGFRYDWLTILRHGLRAIGRVPFPFVLGVGVAAGWTGWTLLGVATLCQVAHRPLSWLLALAPVPNSPRRMICSEQVTRALRAVAGEAAVLSGTPAWMVSPGDLFQALLGRRKWENMVFPRRT